MKLSVVQIAKTIKKDANGNEQETYRCVMQGADLDPTGCTIKTKLIVDAPDPYELDNIIPQRIGEEAYLILNPVQTKLQKYEKVDPKQTKLPGDDIDVQG